MVTTRAATRSASARLTTPPPTASSPAGNALEIDPVAKAKTLAHMNKDHTADLSAILRHFAHLSADDAADPVMLDLDLATLTIASRSGTHPVPLRPPMASWGDRRTRIVEMTVEARKALGLDAVAHEKKKEEEQEEKAATAAAAAATPPQATTVKFFPPAGAGLVSFAGVSWYFLWLGLVYTGHVIPGSAPWRFLELVHFPGGPERFVWLVKLLAVPILLIHGIEAFYVMAVRRLAPQAVPVGSAMWLLWVSCTFVEGLPAWQRFDRKVLGKEKSQ